MLRYRKYAKLYKKLPRNPALNLIILGLFIEELLKYIQPETILTTGFILFISYRTYKMYLAQKIIGIGLTDIDEMSGLEFEEYLKLLFTKLGYKAEKTPHNDYGVDLIVTDAFGTRTAVQAKCYKSNIGLSAIQEVAAGKVYYKCQKGLVVTNRLFTLPAKRLAKSNGITLWDRPILTEKVILSQQEKAYQGLLSGAFIIKSLIQTTLKTIKKLT